VKIPCAGIDANYPQKLWITLWKSDREVFLLAIITGFFTDWLKNNQLIIGLIKSMTYELVSVRY
jgi:hypothetical protein